MIWWWKYDDSWEYGNHGGKPSRIMGICRKWGLSSRQAMGNPQLNGSSMGKWAAQWLSGAPNDTYVGSIKSNNYSLWYLSTTILWIVGFINHLVTGAYLGRIYLPQTRHDYDWDSKLGIIEWFVLNDVLMGEFLAFNGWEGCGGWTTQEWTMRNVICVFSWYQLWLQVFKHLEHTILSVIVKPKDVWYGMFMGQFLAT